jgi:hypothetical protein
MVISGGTFSMAFCISSAALANLLVSMLIPTPHAGQRMRSLDSDPLLIVRVRARISDIEI